MEFDDAAVETKPSNNDESKSTLSVVKRLVGGVKRNVKVHPINNDTQVS